MVNVVPVYQLFITNSDGITTSNVTSNDNIDLSLQLDSEYNITLVATGEDLPSDTFIVTVPQGNNNNWSNVINLYLFLNSCHSNDRRTAYYATGLFYYLFTAFYSNSSN